MSDAVNAKAGNVSTEQVEAKVSDAKAVEAVKSAAAFSDEQKAEIARLVQAESDRKVASVVKERDELRKEIEKARVEKMSAEERARFELEAREKAIAEKETEILKRDIRIKMQAGLAEKGLPADAIDFVTADNSELADARLKSFAKLVDKIRAEAVESVRTGNARTPPATSNAEPTTEAAKIELAIIEARKKGDNAAANRLWLKLRSLKKE